MMKAKLFGQESSHYQEHSITQEEEASGRRASVTIIEMEPFEVKGKVNFL